MIGFQPVILIVLIFNLLQYKLVSTSFTVSSTNGPKYIIYDVNHGEGFNLRRDVFMRIANTVRILRESGHNFVLVIPPWGGLYHWKDRATKIQWSRFFNIESINKFVPVIEFHQFIEERNYNAIDVIVYLQAYAEGWSNGNYELKYNKRECIDGQKYYKLVDGKWRGWFFSYHNVSAQAFLCLSIQGDSATLAKFIKDEYSKTNTNSVFIDRVETILHQNFGDKNYWQARRSMRYATYLIIIGNSFRKMKFDSDDMKDKTDIGHSWIETRKKHGDAIGGNYICVHWRRGDFVRSRRKDIPSIEGTAKQIMKILDSTKLSNVFLSTDAEGSEIVELKSFLPSFVNLVNFDYKNESLLDGEIAIIDQWICAHARYFIGSHSSTFSYRIQEDREILGFEPKTTFNRLCPDDDISCEQPAKWKIVYDNGHNEF